MRSLAMIAGLALASLSVPAQAASTQEYLSLCAAAFDASGAAPAADYRAKFVKSKGGGVKTVTIELIPNGGGETLSGVCRIKRGEVIEAEVEA